MSCLYSKTNLFSKHLLFRCFVSTVLFSPLPFFPCHTCRCLLKQVWKFCLNCWSQCYASLLWLCFNTWSSSCADAHSKYQYCLSNNLDELRSEKAKMGYKTWKEYKHCWEHFERVERVLRNVCGISTPFHCCIPKCKNMVLMCHWTVYKETEVLIHLPSLRRRII